MNKNYYVLLLVVGIFSFKTSFSQDPEFSQFYANPLYLNPALAGSNMCPRVCINYRNQWPAISANYVTTSVSLDKFIYKIKGGLGLLVTNDRAGQGTLNTTNVSAMYSYQLRVTRKLAFNFGLQATYGQKSLNWNKLTFEDMIDDKMGFVKNTSETGSSTTKSFSDFSAGILGFTKHIFVGVAVNHLTQPDEGLMGNVSKLPMKVTGHAGVVIPLNGERGDVSISPNILFQQQQNFRQLNLGFYVNKGPMVGGLWYRSNDSFIALIGIQKGMFKAGYSYDITVSKLTNASAGAHELSVGLRFGCKKPKKIYRPDICPNF